MVLPDKNRRRNRRESRDFGALSSELGRCPSTVLRVALGRALIYEGNETVLGTNPNRTHDQPKPYLETAETVLDLYSDKGMFPLLLRGAHKKNSLKTGAFPKIFQSRFGSFFGSFFAFFKPFFVSI